MAARTNSVTKTIETTRPPSRPVRIRRPGGRPADRDGGRCAPRGCRAPASAPGRPGAAAAGSGRGRRCRRRAGSGRGGPARPRALPSGRLAGARPSGASPALGRRAPGRVVAAPARRSRRLRPGRPGADRGGRGGRVVLMAGAPGRACGPPRPGGWRRSRRRTGAAGAAGEEAGPPAGAAHARAAGAGRCSRR